MSALTVSSYDPAPKLGDVKPHVTEAARLLAEKFGLTQMSGYRASAHDKTGHPAGLAIDIPTGRDVGDAVAKFAAENARALGVKYVIWQQRIWTPSNPTWTLMATRPGDRPGYDPNHLRHVHISFTESAPDRSLLDRLRSGVSNAVGAVTGAVGNAVEQINPLDDWQGKALGVGIKLAAVGAGLTLLIIGANRLVAPAVTGAVERTIDRATEVLT